MLTVRLCAAGLSFIAFATALVIGLLSDNEYVTIVNRALTIMVVFYVLGAFVGKIGQIAVEESFEREKAAIEAEVKAEFEKKKSEEAAEYADLEEVSSEEGSVAVNQSGAEKARPVGAEV